MILTLTPLDPGFSVGVVTPSITDQPDNASANVGSTATFSITATGSPLTYQWQRKDSGALGWVDVYGATSSSYTTTTLDEFDNGTKFRCDINDGELISDEVTLTVVFANELFFADFLSGTDSFSAGTRTTDIGPYQTAGALSVGAGVTATRSFTAISSGIGRIDIHIRVNDTDTAADASKNTFVYLMPTSGAVSSANSITTLAISRFTSNANATFYSLEHRDNSGFSLAINTAMARTQWAKVSVIFNMTAKTYDLLLNDLLIEKDRSFANASASDCSRLVLLGGASAPATLFDAVRVISSYTAPTESVVVYQDFTVGNGDIADATPATYRTLHPQGWNEPEDSATYGGLSLSSSGAAASGSLPSFANQTGLADGIIEAEFKTSVSGVIYFGLQLRFWDYQGNGSSGLLRVFGGSTNTIVLSLPDVSGTMSAAGSAALTPSANSTYTLKCEVRGRRFVVSYKNAAIDAGSYTTAFTFLADDSGVGGRGMLSEEIFGPLFAPNAAATDNYCTKIRFTGIKPREKTVRIGNYTAVLSPGSIRELYSSGYASATKNLFWSKGIQFGHRSRADMGNRWSYWNTIAEADNVAAYRQVASNLTEYQHLGSSDCYITFTRRGVYVSDAVDCEGNTENYAPDTDFDPHVFAGDYLAVGPSGSSSTLSDLPYETWRNDVGASLMPLGYQRVSQHESNNVRITNVGINIANLGTAIQLLTHKYTGSGEPISHAMPVPTGSIVAGTEYRMGRAYLIESGQSSLSNTVLTEFRDDLADPATFSFTTGSSKTDASGDANTDGWNERHGWYELTASGNSLDFDNDATKRIKPIFRIHSMTARPAVVTVGGVTKTEGTDYFVDELGGNQWLLQFEIDIAGSAAITIDD